MSVYDVLLQSQLLSGVYSTTNEFYYNFVYICKLYTVNYNGTV